MQFCLAYQAHQTEVLGLILRIKLWERKLFVDTVGTAENSAEFALGHILHLDVRLGCTADTATILQKIRCLFNLLPVRLQTFWIDLEHRKSLFLGVEWETCIVGTNSNDSLSTVKGMRLLHSWNNFDALLKLRVEGRLVFDHLDDALIDVCANRFNF